MKTWNAVRTFLPAIAVVGVAGLLIVAAVVFQRSSRPETSRPVVAAQEVMRAELEWRGGKLYRGGETQAFSGLMLERHIDGTLKSRSAVTNGLLHGLSEGWHTNGQLQVSETFREGTSHGLRTKWYGTGQRQSEAAILNGKLHGVFRSWHENGVLAETLQMVEGKPDGTAIAYFPSGCLKSRATLRSGEVIEQKFWKDGASSGQSDQSERAQLTSSNASARP